MKEADKRDIISTHQQLSDFEWSYFIMLFTMNAMFLCETGPV